MLKVLQIARMTTHNGPGLRTNVHFMGCPLRCCWCSTPESQRSTGGLGHDIRKCVGCGACAEACPTGALRLGRDGRAMLDRGNCIECFQCTGACYADALWQYGREWTAENLLDELKKDSAFFRQSGGGVTLSGGECLMHVDSEMESLCRGLREAGITIGADTCGYVPWENIERLLPCIHFFLWDLKLLDPEEHKQYTGVDNRLILENLKRLNGVGVEIYIRYPLIPGINDSDEDIAALCRLLSKLTSVRELHLLPFHHLGKRRYECSGMAYPMEGVPIHSRKELEHKRQLAETLGISCRIVG